MNLKKLPMSWGYRAIFSLSVFMSIFLIILGASKGSGGAGIGVWYWVYMAWKMYRRDNFSLLLLQKIMLWIHLISIAFLIILIQFSKIDIGELGMESSELVVLASISVVTICLLLRFFEGQLNALSDARGKTAELELVSDKYWEMASEELNSYPHAATWARSFSLSEGDESKARATYLRLRALALQSANGPMHLTDNAGAISSTDGGVFNTHFLIAIVSLAGIGYLFFLDAQSGGSNQPEGGTLSESKQQPYFDSSFDERASLSKSYFAAYTSIKSDFGFSFADTRDSAIDIAKKRCKRNAADGSTCDLWFVEQTNCAVVAKNKIGGFGAGTDIDSTNSFGVAMARCSEASGGMDCDIVFNECVE